MGESVTGLCGPKGAHDPDRRAVRHGTEAGCGAWVAVRCRCVARGFVPWTGPPRWRCRPMSCSRCRREFSASSRSERMMAKLSTRRYAAGLEPVGSAVAGLRAGRRRVLR